MAGSTLAYPLNGAANWEAFPDIVQKIQAGYMRLGLTNFGNNNEPEIAAGSTLDVNGACCVFSAAESITGWAGIAISTDVYIKVVVTGAVVTAEFTTDAPTWSATKQGWYDGNDRYIGGLYKDASSNYTIKWLYPENPGDPVNQEMIREGETRPLLEKVIEIGDWNMDLTAALNVAHGIPNWENIRDCQVLIRNDAANENKMLGYYGEANTFFKVKATNIELYRATGGVWDNANYDSTSFNRGWIYIRYRA